jgi:hypothetical protein|nr:MAG TPA: hypothetical protein [Caudoviricetes sp.]
MKEKFDMIFYPSTIEQLNLLLNGLAENSDYIAKMGKIEIGLAHKTENSQTFYIHRDIS